jgi:hypothetical protein
VTTHVRKVVPALKIFILDRHFEPHQESQKFAENRYSTFKDAMNRVLIQHGVPAGFWFQALEYNCQVFKLLVGSSEGWILPLQAQASNTLLLNAVSEPVYYNPHDFGIPSNYFKVFGRWVGVVINVGHYLPF